jgi:hypothetical protein
VAADPSGMAVLAAMLVLGGVSVIVIGRTFFSNMVQTN